MNVKICRISDSGSGYADRNIKFIAVMFRITYGFELFYLRKYDIFLRSELESRTPVR